MKFAGKSFCRRFQNAQHSFHWNSGTLSGGVKKNTLKLLFHWHSFWQTTQIFSQWIQCHIFIITMTACTNDRLPQFWSTIAWWKTWKFWKKEKITKCMAFGGGSYWNSVCHKGLQLLYHSKGKCGCTCLLSFISTIVKREEMNFLFFA